MLYTPLRRSDARNHRLQESVLRPITIVADLDKCVLPFCLSNYLPLYIGLIVEPGLRIFEPGAMIATTQRKLEPPRLTRSDAIPSSLHHRGGASMYGTAKSTSTTITISGPKSDLIRVHHKRLSALRTRLRSSLCSLSSKQLLSPCTCLRQNQKTTTLSIAQIGIVYLDQTSLP